jgi:hypothetical protein
MAKKKKSKLKKLGTALAAGLAGAALLGRNREKPLVPKYFGMNSGTTGDANIAENIANFNQGMDRMSKFTPSGNSGVAYMKKGGRVGVGVAKRGFGRAMKKGKK